MSPQDSKLRLRLALGGILLTLLLAAAFTLGSLDVPFQFGNWRDVLALYSVSTFITAAILVFGLILIRTIVRLWMERSKQQPGARFKTKMVLGAMVLSLLPILFMFFISYSLLNRTLARWFPRPLELAVTEARGLLADSAAAQMQRLDEIAGAVSGPPLSSPGAPGRRRDLAPPEEWPAKALLLGADAAWLLHGDGSISQVLRRPPAEGLAAPRALRSPVAPSRGRPLPGGTPVWLLADEPYLSNNSQPFPQGAVLIVARLLPPSFLARYAGVETQFRAYEEGKQNLRALKTQMLLVLLLFTLLLFFSALWTALFLAKQITIPILALAEGTREISAGNFNYQVPEQAQDELGVLVRSFNAMTTQLRDSRLQIDEFTRNLQQAVQELERRRQLMETILENIPTGVASLDEQGALLRVNPAMTRITGVSASEMHKIEDLLGPEAAYLAQNMMRRALRMGVVTREIEIVVQDRVLHAAVTVSSLGPRRANSGFVLVLDDLTEVLRAQKSAAWQEVARRIAHEIKNPLTPIQLSAQRLARFIERRAEQDSAAADPELTGMAMECSRLIEREVATLASLVNEFTQFVRFPTAHPAPTDANEIVREALEVFAGRLEGISIRTHLQSKLPVIRADGRLLRSVFVNLIDNAAEALENSPRKEIHILTSARADTDMVEICVQDTGHGISPEDKDRLFLPTFSTKDRGTGLGLAIAARIIAEHGGTIRVEDNRPVGSRFYVELPVMDPLGASSGEHPNGGSAS
jgi:two-component system nitrogen regulation sensor histidine kinase NtrY